MKRLMLALPVLVLSLSAMAQTVPVEMCAGMKKIQQREAAELKDRFTVGEVTRVDVKNNEYDGINIAYFCGDLTKAEYCAQSAPVLQVLVDGALEEFRLGMRTSEQVDVIVKKQADQEKLCQ